MTSKQSSTNTTTDNLDYLIKEHITENDESRGGEPPVAAVSASDRFSWAKQAGVEVDVVDRYMAITCQEVKNIDEHWAVPRYRLKVE